MFNVRITIDVPASIEDLAHGGSERLMNESIVEAVTNHQRKHLRRHFEPGNRSRYAHRDRSPAWNARKRRQYGHQIDNVFSGETRDHVLRQPVRVQLRRGSGGVQADVSIRLPFRTPPGARIDVAAGLSRWAYDESREAAADVLRIYHQKRTARRGRRKRLGT